MLKEGPRFDAMTIHFTTGVVEELTSFLTDVVIAIAESSWPVPKIIFATEPTEVKEGPLRMFFGTRGDG